MSITIHFKFPSAITIHFDRLISDYPECAHSCFCNSKLLDISFPLYLCWAIELLWLVIVARHGFGEIVSTGIFSIFADGKAVFCKFGICYFFVWLVKFYFYLYDRLIDIKCKKKIVIISIKVSIFLVYQLTSILFATCKFKVLVLNVEQALTRQEDVKQFHDIFCL